MCVTCAFFNPFAGDWLHVGQSDRTIIEASIAGGDVPEGLETSVTLLVGDTFEGAIGTVGDWDWFAVEATEGVSYTITMTPGTMDDPYFAIYERARSMGEDFIEAMLAGFVSILCAPDFLYLENQAGEL